MSKLGYMSAQLRKSATVDIMGLSRDIDLSGLAAGCCGVLLVFEDIESAKEYTNDNAEILPITWEP